MYATIKRGTWLAALGTVLVAEWATFAFELASWLDLYWSISAEQGVCPSQCRQAMDTQNQTLFGPTAALVLALAETEKLPWMR